MKEQTIEQLENIAESSGNISDLDGLKESNNVECTCQDYCGNDVDDKCDCDNNG